MCSQCKQISVEHSNTHTFSQPKLKEQLEICSTVYVTTNTIVSKTKEGMGNLTTVHSVSGSFNYIPFIGYWLQLFHKDGTEDIQYPKVDGVTVQVSGISDVTFSEVSVGSVKCSHDTRAGIPRQLTGGPWSRVYHGTPGRLPEDTMDTRTSQVSGDPASVLAL